jgi:hypothetical protein
MQNSLLKSLMITSVVLSVIGCGGGSSSSGVIEEEIVPDEPLSTLSQELKDSITFMYNEEGLAYDVYMNIYKIQPVNQLESVAMNSETKHIEWVNELAIKYDLNMTTYDPTLEPYSKEGIGDGKYSVQHIQDLYDLLYTKGIKSEKDALEVGCMVEVVDVKDLEEYIALATESNATDVLETFNKLIEGSYNHYWTFDTALMNMNDPTDPNAGCCSVVDEFSLGFDFCQPNYPKK